VSTHEASPDQDADAVPGGMRSRLRHQSTLLAWLVLVWMLLWGTWSWANLISGLAVALLVTTLLPLPPVVGSTRVHPAALAVYVGSFLADVVVSAAQVAWRTLSPSGVRRSAIIQVEMRTDSDLLLTVIAESLSLVPGSIVIDLDREAQTLALHVLHVEDMAAVERARERVLAMEDRVVRALGRPEEIAALDRAPRPGGRRTP
jgi:multicomponent Na+:H+ antiporter subunit E